MAQRLHEKEEEAPSGVFVGGEKTGAGGGEALKGTKRGRASRFGKGKKTKEMKHQKRKAESDRSARGALESSTSTEDEEFWQLGKKGNGRENRKRVSDPQEKRKGKIK